MVVASRLLLLKAKPRLQATIAADFEALMSGSFGPMAGTQSLSLLMLSLSMQAVGEFLLVNPCEES